MTAPLFLLRCVQLGLNVSELDLLTVGTVLDMLTERQNDSCTYDYVASQEDMDSL